jgi:pimeloyl-ACP methyl ester carboxylesterase
MHRLGYRQYFAQGGDWGSFITNSIARRHPGSVLGIHLNSPVAPPDPATAGEYTDWEKRSLADAAYFDRTGRGYSAIQGTRPQTLGYGLSDSPVAQCAWIAEKLWFWSDHDGDISSILSRDQILDNVSLYWFTATGASSARLYWESAQTLQSNTMFKYAATVDRPAAISIFPREIVRPAKRWCERLFSDLRFYELSPHGGHFAALEQPDIFVDHLRRAFATMP